MGDARDYWRQQDDTVATPPAAVVAALERARTKVQSAIREKGLKAGEKACRRRYWTAADPPEVDPSEATRRAVADYMRAMRNIRKGAEVSKLDRAYAGGDAEAAAPAASPAVRAGRRKFNAPGAGAGPGGTAALEVDFAAIRRLYLALPDGDRRAQARVVRALLALIEEASP